MKHLVVLVFFVMIVACASTGSSSDDLAELVPHTGDGCICGSPEADLFGCHCEDCLLRGGNPDNADCTCLPLAPPSDISNTTQVSLGGATGTSGGLVGFQTIVLKRGGRTNGTVLDDDGEQIRFKHEDGREATYTYDELSTRSIYKLLKAQTDQSDGAAELRLATFARDCGLYAHARRHFGYALAADPELEESVRVEVSRLDELASASQVAEAREAFDAGKEKEAREHLETVLTEYSDQPAAKGARAMLTELENQRLERSTARAAKARAESVASAAEPAEIRLEKARGHSQAGLVAGSQASAIREFERAVNEGKRCGRDIARERKQARSDPAILAALQEVEVAMNDLMGDTHLHLASVYLRRTDYRKAMRAANAALEIDPNDEEALQMRARIETAENEWWVDDGDLRYRQRYRYWPGAVRRVGVGRGRRVGYGVSFGRFF